MIFGANARMTRVYRYFKIKYPCMKYEAKGFNGD